MSGSDREAKKTDPAVQAATALFFQYEDLIRTTIRFHAGSKLDPEDLFQEFYLSLICRPLPADVRDIRSYLYRAATNYVTSQLRRQRSYSHHQKKYAQEAENSIYNRPPRDALVEDEQRNVTITRLAGLLQQRLGQAFVLKHRDGYNILEIAVRMGVHRRTVSRYLSESAEKLRRRLAAE